MTWVALERLTDLYVEDGEGVALVDDRVMLLSRVATAAVLALEDGTGMNVDDLAQRLVAVFGPPPAGDPEASTRTMLDLLAGQGICSFTDEPS